MPTYHFNTLSDDLQSTAHACCNHWRNLGYTVRKEERELGYPYVPTVLSSRAGTTLVIEVMESFNELRVRKWIAYGKSLSRDFRLAVVLGPNTTSSSRAEATTLCNQARVGLYTTSSDSLNEVIPPTDLAIPFQVPDIGDLSREKRVLIGPAVEQARKGDWVPAFDEACKAIDQYCRKHLAKGVKSSRIQFANGKTPTRKAIEKLTIGQLCQHFRDILSPNKDDMTLLDCLESINRDRVDSTHHNKKAGVVRRLRANAGQHLWTIVQAFRDV